MNQCRICDGGLQQFLDLGEQPLSDAFRDPADESPEFTYPLTVGACTDCGMVQLMQEVPRERMFHHDYPFRTATSAFMRQHFEDFARRMLATELTGDSPFIVEIGCNDGTMLRTIASAGVRHLGVDPAVGAVEDAAADGIRVRADFFEESTAADIRATDGPADVVYAANTICHIPYLDSIFQGLTQLLKPTGVFIFEDPYLGDIVRLGSYDQIYDEHYYLFSAHSVAQAAQRFGFALVDVERLGVHGGEVRYTVARSGARTPTPAVSALLAEEAAQRLHDWETLKNFAQVVEQRRDGLVEVLRKLRQEGRSVAGYGATAKSATVLNYCGITSDLLPQIYDITPAKQHKVTPGSHIPVLPFPESVQDYPEYFLLFAWNHATEITAKETAFHEAGGKWIRYVPEVRID